MPPATVFDFITGDPQTMVVPEPPEPEEEFQLYEKPLDHSRPPPPGIPFGYVLEVKSCTCRACGSVSRTSRLFQIVRSGYGSAVYGMGINAPVYDRPIKRIDKAEGTPVCLKCINDLRPEPVLYPAPGKAVGLFKGEKSKTPPPPTPAADVAGDFV